MITQIIELLINIIIQIIATTRYIGIFFLMLLESCGVPIPSEVTMPFSGFLVATGQLSFWAVVAVGTLGNIAGSILAYYIALKGGRPPIEKYGKFILISKHDLNMADRWFSKHGEMTVLVGRLLPVIRTYISFPAGISKMNLKKFTLYTFMGSLPWSILFTYLGIKLQNNWKAVESQLHNFDLAILMVVVLVIGLYVWRHIRHRRM